VCAAVGHDDLGGDGVGLVLDVQHDVLRQAAHPGEQELGVAADQLGPPGDLVVEPLGLAVI
jgi:hypothetical protein